MRFQRLLAALFVSAVLPVGAEMEHFTFDPAHTYPSFEAPHMGISWWRGKFNKTRGTLSMDRDAGTGTVDIAIDVSSIDFGHDEMNEHALKKDFFNVAQYPTIAYTGVLVFKDGAPSEVDGMMTLLGVTKPLKLTISSFKCIRHPLRNKKVCGADASGEFNRADFGMTKSADGPLGKVRLEIQAEAVKD